MVTIVSDFNCSGKSHKDIDDAFAKIKEAIHTVANTLPRSTYKKNLKPYWNSELSLPSGYSLFVDYKEDKKLFHSTLKILSKDYEN